VEEDEKTKISENVEGKNCLYKSEMKEMDLMGI
jgi:hypothetical protein